MTPPLQLFTLSAIPLRLAKACAVQCARVYSDVTLQSDVCHALRSDYDGSALIAFRGTRTMREWLIDARIKWWNLGLGLVHSGFWDSLNTLFPQLDQIAQAGPVIITGHSKGAAEALLCAWRMTRLGRQVKAVVTFGGPRVGNGAWRRDYNAQLGERTWRWVHQEDIVCRLPVWLTGYRHVGQECFLDPFGTVELNPPFWRMLIAALWDTWLSYSKTDIEPITDHPISQYLEHLDKLS